MYLARLFQRSVDLYADRPALAQGTQQQSTYATLDVHCRTVAAWLRNGLGLARGDRVLIAMQNRPEYLQALLALWNAGLCPVPVNSKLHAQEIDYMLEDSGARVCLSSGALLQQLTPVVAQRTDVALIDVCSADWQRAGQPLSRAEVVQGQGDELAWLFYTSGTTGRPKGVMLTHANIVTMALNFYADVLPIDTHDALIHAAPLSHGSGMYSIAWMLRGGLQVIPQSGGFDAAELFDLCAHYPKASLFAAPTMVSRMVTHAQQQAQDTPVCPGLRCIMVGGAPFYVQDIKAAVQQFGPRIAQIYGQGESPMTISALSATRIAQAVAENDDALLASVGWPQTTATIEIRDTQGQGVAAGELGEVTVRGPSVMRGYWRNPEATAKTVPDGVLYTGDIGLLDERGLLHLRDRSKDVIISGGTNIYPREVEEVLLRHAQVAEVSVVGTPDPEWGEAVTAVVVTREDVLLDNAELDALCLAHIARFKRPKHYVFVQTLPKNATGKVLKNDLRDMLAQRAQSAA